MLPHLLKLVIAVDGAREYFQPHSIKIEIAVAIEEDLLPHSLKLVIAVERTREGYLPHFAKYTIAVDRARRIKLPSRKQAVQVLVRQEGSCFVMR